MIVRNPFSEVIKYVFNVIPHALAALQMLINVLAVNLDYFICLILAIIRVLLEPMNILVNVQYVIVRVVLAKHQLIIVKDVQIQTYI